MQQRERHQEGTHKHFSRCSPSFSLPLHAALAALLSGFTNICAELAGARGGVGVYPHPPPPPPGSSPPIPYPPPQQCEEQPQGTPQRPGQGAGGAGGGGGSGTPPPSPLWDIEGCTPVRVPKRHRMQTPSNSRRNRSHGWQGSWQHQSRLWQ